MAISVEARQQFDPLRWDEIVASFPGANICQTAEYFDFRKRMNDRYEKVHLLARDENGSLLGIALCLLLRETNQFARLLGQGGKAEIRFGPLIKGSENYDETDVLNEMISEFDRLCKYYKLASSIVFPPPKSSIAHVFPQKRNDFELYCTYLVDLKRDERDIFQQISRSGRRNVRMGYRELQLLNLTESSDSIVGDIYKLHKEKLSRVREAGGSSQEFSEEWFRNTIDVFVKKNLGNYVAALYNNELVSADCTIGFGDFGFSWLSDSSRKYSSRVKSGYVLRWEGILWSQRQGFSYYDFGQVPCNPDPESEKYGVYFFKREFGGEYCEVHNRYNTYPYYGAYVARVLGPPYRGVKNICQRLGHRK